jgi:Zn finger protein HypA/HybF involved in hydrogenase expression
MAKFTKGMTLEFNPLVHPDAKVTLVCKCGNKRGVQAYAWSKKQHDVCPQCGGSECEVV